MVRDPLKRGRLHMVLAKGGRDGAISLGRYRQAAAFAGLKPHSHRRAMEICFLVKGRQTYRVGGKEYRLRGGDIFLTFPDERHDTAGYPQEKGVLYWMIVKLPRTGKTFFELSARSTALLVRNLRGLKQRHFRGDDEIKRLLDEITLLYHEDTSALRMVKINNRAIAFLLRAIERAGEIPTEPGTQRFEVVRRYLDQHLAEPLTVPVLAAQAGLSVSRFKIWFKAETGVPPLEYLLRARVEEARRRLQQGTSVTRVAYDLGFSSSQYFATVFKRYTGRQPRTYR